MQKSHHVTVLFTELLFLSWLGFLGAKQDDSSGSFRLEDYTRWLKNHEIQLVNYVAEVGSKALIMSPITPAPVSLQWFSLNMNGDLPNRDDKDVSFGTAKYLKLFKNVYNISWHDVFKYDELGRGLRMLNVRLEYSDVFRVYVDESRMANVETDQETDEGFYVDITLMTFEQHVCGFTSTPQTPSKGDVLILNCSVVVNGLWNASLIFRDDFDGSETRGEVSECGPQPIVGSRICSTVRIKSASIVFAYSCLLEFPSSGRMNPRSPLFHTPKWTAEFNQKAVCNLPRIHLQSIPSDISLLCNRKPCADTASVDDTVTCLAHGYPEPTFDLRIQPLLPDEDENESESGDSDWSNDDIRMTRDTVDSEKAKAPVDTIGRHNVSSHVRTVTIDRIKVFENYQISRNDVGKAAVSCNTSNALGSGYKALVLEVRSQHERDVTVTTRRRAAADFHPYDGMTMLCNGKTCRNWEIMRFGDDIACHYDENQVNGKLRFVLKVNGFEKNVQSPCVYTLRRADVGRKLVQCIGYLDSSISLLEVNIGVVCGFRYSADDPHRTQDYDDIAEGGGVDKSGLTILCNDAPCNKPGHIIYTEVNYLTCRYTDQRVASLLLYVGDKLVFEQTPINSTEGFYRLNNNDQGTLTVRCVDKADAAATVYINITVELWPCPVDTEEDVLDQEAFGSEAAGQIPMPWIRESYETTTSRLAETTTSRLAGAAAGSLNIARMEEDDDYAEAEHYAAFIQEEEVDDGNCGQESFVLLELLLVFVGFFVSRFQF